MSHLCPSFAAAALCLTALAQEPPAPRETQAPQVTVRVDPRVELLSVVFRLAGNPEYNQGKVAAYTEAVDARFGAFEDHAAVRRARALRRMFGVGYDACMSMAVHLEDAEKLNEAVPFEPRPPGLDARWHPREARRFVDDLRRFVADTRFLQFFAEHAELYRTAVARMQKVLQDAKLGWFDGFFGARPAVRFELALGMLNGGACYGPRVVHSDGTEDLHCVLGVWATDAEGLPRFDTSMLQTVVHEFCHSYCNPLVDAHLDELREPAEKLWPHVADSMRSQAYGNWGTMMRESLVRACVVRYATFAGGEAAGRRAAAYEESRDFLWTGELAELLGEYEAQRERYPTLDAFFPQVAAFFARYAPELDARMAAAPKVVSMTPANGAEDVDPSLSAITVTFDRPMLDRAWAFVGGGPHYPETTGPPAYDDERRTVTLPVKLKPDWSYELWLNRGRFSSFQSAERVPLRPVRVTFKTRAGRR